MLYLDLDIGLLLAPRVGTTQVPGTASVAEPQPKRTALPSRACLGLTLSSLSKQCWWDLFTKAASQLICKNQQLTLKK